MPYAYTEVQLVKQSTIGLLVKFGWQTASAMNEILSIISPGQPATLPQLMGKDILTDHKALLKMALLHNLLLPRLLSGHVNLEECNG